LAKAKSLTMGIDLRTTSPQEESERVAVLRATVEKYLPAFAKSVAQVAARAKNDVADTVLLHQDAFAAGYDDDEYTLLGMAVKYAGLHGVVITVMGKNHETF